VDSERGEDTQCEKWKIRMDRIRNKEKDRWERNSNTDSTNEMLKMIRACNANAVSQTAKNIIMHITGLHQEI